LSQLGCRQMPTPHNLADLIQVVAQYEFCCKPLAAVTMINSGLPMEHKRFWEDLGISGIKKLYDTLTATPEKVLSLVEGFCSSKAEERVFGYLKTLIGNMGQNELHNFLRFVTGSSVCVAKNITVNFNTLSGFQRRPFARTCPNVLELSVEYNNYHDFSAEWSTILNDTGNKWLWRMDIC